MPTGSRRGEPPSSKAHSRRNCAAARAFSRVGTAIPPQFHPPLRRRPLPPLPEANVADLGLAIEITELDVDDRAYPADIAQRDAAVAAFVKRYLDVVLDEPAVLNVLTWGYADGASWYDHSERARGDGLPNRGLPYSEDESPLP